MSDGPPVTFEEVLALNAGPPHVAMADESAMLLAAGFEPGIELFSHDPAPFLRANLAWVYDRHERPAVDLPYVSKFPTLWPGETPLHRRVGGWSFPDNWRGDEYAYLPAGSWGFAVGGSSGDDGASDAVDVGVHRHVHSIFCAHGCVLCHVDRPDPEPPVVAPVVPLPAGGALMGTVMAVWLWLLLVRPALKRRSR